MKKILTMVLVLIFGMVTSTSFAMQLSHPIKTIMNIEKRQNKNIPSNAKEYAGHYYYVYADVCTTWDEAEEYCESLGGHLAVINDANENQILYDMMKEFGYSSAYFGLTDLTSSGRWRWVNNDPVTYTNWNPGEPNHERGKEHYGMFYWKFKYTWNDGDFGQGTNSGGTAFICEWDSGFSSNVVNDYHNPPAMLGRTE